MPPLDSPPSRPPEFSDEASGWPADLDRRQFLELMGASVALAGLAGCRPAKTLVPYVVQPASVVPGIPAYYATAMPVEGFGRGILVEAHEGRPTKIEGNGAHAESRGATDAITQASVLSLYDPDRSAAPRRESRPAAWSEFEGEWRSRFAAGRGEGGAILTEPTSSPALRRGLYALLERYPALRWYQHTPLARFDEGGRQDDFRLEEADVVFAIEADFLQGHPAALRYARSFAARRRMQGGVAAPNRLHAIESAWTVTGTMADHRLAAGPRDLPRILNAIAGAGALSDPGERAFVARLVRDLHAQAPRVLVVAGPEQPLEVRQWARAMNQRFGAVGRAAFFRRSVRSDADPRCAGDLAALAQAMAQGGVKTLAILGCNPAYTAPAGLDFVRRLSEVEFSVHAGLYVDETAAHCRWHLAESHFLEAWGDLRGYDGSGLIQQPLIEPLYDTRSLPEVIRLLSDAPVVTGYELVREAWRSASSRGDFEAAWADWVRRGVAEEASEPDEGPAGRAEPPRLQEGAEPKALTLVFRADPTLADGRWANNGWLQELPRPVTSLVWDNVLHLPPGLAREKGLANGDLVAVETAGRTVEAAVWIMPGQAEDCLLAHWGGGRSAAGRVGNGRGFDAYRLRENNSEWSRTGVELRPTGRSIRLASTQHHFAMEGRAPVRWMRAGGLLPDFETTPAHSLYPAERKPDTYAWGMSIDLSTCLGCGACVAACQAENNGPVVGKEQVLRGREMHWIRIDQYHGEAEGEAKLFSQPVPCMQCEDAPCELVCPVGATVHSSEGLNEMVYNRCVGTRYCSNNCPYKVRRFNFFDYRAARDSVLHLAENPEVTVRQRGVMEKCTYCVQRIDRARSTAEREGRLIRDGEIRTACQQACPAEAIVFGNIRDPQSAVAARKREPANYALLAELNTRPRTTYLAKVINPA